MQCFRLGWTPNWRRQTFVRKRGSAAAETLQTERRHSDRRFAEMAYRPVSERVARGGGHPEVQASEARCAVAAAMSTASALDLAVDDAVILNASNRLVVRLTPCDVVARVTPPASLEPA